MKTGDHAIPHWKRIFQIFLPMLWVLGFLGPDRLFLPCVGVLLLWKG